MRKTKITKKSGTIAYQLNPRYDLQGEATEKNPLMGVSVVSSTPVTTKEMADRISHACTLHKADVVAVLNALGHELSEALLDGRTVQIDEIGSFSVKLGLKEPKPGRPRHPPRCGCQGRHLPPLQGVEGGHAWCRDCEWWTRRAHPTDTRDCRASPACLL